MKITKVCWGSAIAIAVFASIFENPTLGIINPLQPILLTIAGILAVAPIIIGIARLGKGWGFAFLGLITVIVLALTTH